MRTGYWVALAGAGVSLLGWSMVESRLGAGLLGFGLAHVLLGFLDASLARKGVRYGE